MGSTMLFVNIDRSDPCLFTIRWQPRFGEPLLKVKLIRVNAFPS